jgi:hypothetical protein
MPGDGRAFRGHRQNAADLETVRPPDATAEACHGRSSRIGNGIRQKKLEKFDGVCPLGRVPVSRWNSGSSAAYDGSRHRQVYGAAGAALSGRPIPY